MSDWTALPGERFELGEGLRFVDGRLVMVDILSGRLLEIPPDGGAPRVLVTLTEPLGAVAPRAGGGWIAAAGAGIAVLGEPGDRLEDAATMRMNDGVADPAGRFWAGSMAYDGTPGAGSLYRADPDGTITTALGDLTVPNGPAFDATGTTMYLADSARGLIFRFDVGTTGELTDRHTFAEIPSGSPDGMTVDADGFLWTAVWGAAEVRRYAPDGTVDQVLPVPATQPTSVCLTGTHLHVTTATHGLDAPGPLDGAVLSLPCSIAPTPTRYFGH
ncbi:SMP-30/gluconolactonase/LRE family protein [Amycolatopsis magusensis]|uniref:SMP-30/gluconolactonase/LRE family protein n=1 Tax=Amycolatopsis magusensis TaxID=882444 RepID=UPI0037B574D5